MRPMLAGKYRADKVEAKLPLWGQVKYDGIRVFVMDGVAYTRSLKPVRNQWVQSWVAHNKSYLEGLDGEIICGDPTAEDCYRRTMQFVMSYEPEDEFTFYAFDKWDEMDRYEERYEVVQEIYGHMISIQHHLGSMVPAETTPLSTMNEVWEYYEARALEGHEGIILRDPDSYYKYGRGSPIQCECVKMKEGGWVDTEGKIIALYEEMHNGNEATINALGHTEHSGHKAGLVGKDTLGAVEVEGAFEDGSPFTVRVGTGFDHATRREVWQQRDAYVGRLIKMSYFKIGIKDKPRFPRFLGFRDPDDMDPGQGELF